MVVYLNRMLCQSLRSQFEYMAENMFFLAANESEVRKSSCVTVPAGWPTW